MISDNEIYHQKSLQYNGISNWKWFVRQEPENLALRPTTQTPTYPFPFVIVKTRSLPAVCHVIIFRVIESKWSR